MSAGKSGGTVERRKKLGKHLSAGKSGGPLSAGKTGGKFRASSPRRTYAPLEKNDEDVWTLFHNLSSSQRSGADRAGALLERPRGGHHGIRVDVRRHASLQSWVPSYAPTRRKRFGLCFLGQRPLLARKSQHGMFFRRSSWSACGLGDAPRFGASSRQCHEIDILAPTLQSV